jgi:hypothetical protein
MKIDGLNDHKALLSKMEYLRSDCVSLSSSLALLVPDLQKGQLAHLKSAAERMTYLVMNFEVYKKEVLSFAADTAAPVDPDTLTSLEALDPLLQSSHVQLRQDALRVLDEIQSIEHKDNKDFQPLLDCHEQAKALQQAILQIDLPQLHPDIPALLSGAHPLTEMLALVRYHRDMDEERLAELEDRVQNTFGKLLFLAIVRDKLTIQAQPSVKQAPALVKTKAEAFDLDRKGVADENQGIKEWTLLSQRKTEDKETPSIKKVPDYFPRTDHKGLSA